MIEVIVLTSRLNSDVMILIAYIPHFVVDMAKIAAAVVGCVQRHNHTTPSSLTVYRLW
jgi:hypothetical protein